jgi:hypothetical protein
MARATRRTVNLCTVTPARNKFTASDDGMKFHFSCVSPLTSKLLASEPSVFSQLATRQPYHKPGKIQSRQKSIGPRISSDKLPLDATTDSSQATKVETVGFREESLSDTRKTPHERPDHYRSKQWKTVYRCGVRNYSPLETKDPVTRLWRTIAQRESVHLGAVNRRISASSVSKTLTMMQT